MDTLAEWATKMQDAMIQFKDAAEVAWELLESHGVTVEKLEEVKKLVAAGTITRRMAWARLGLPPGDFPGE